MELTWEPPLCWPFYHVRMLSSVGESQQQSYPAVDPMTYSNKLTGKVCSIGQQWQDQYEITNHFMIGFAAQCTGRNSCLMLQTFRAPMAATVMDSSGGTYYCCSAKWTWYQLLTTYIYIQPLVLLSAFVKKLLLTVSCTDSQLPRVLRITGSGVHGRKRNT